MITMMMKEMITMTMIVIRTMKKQITGQGKAKSQENQRVATTTTTITTTSESTKIKSTKHSTWEVILRVP